MLEFDRPKSIHSISSDRSSSKRLYSIIRGNLDTDFFLDKMETDSCATDRAETLYEK